MQRLRQEVVYTSNERRDRQHGQLSVRLSVRGTLDLLHFSLACRLRNYLDAVNAKLVEGVQHEEQHRSWIAWAEGFVSRLDPLHDRLPSCHGRSGAEGGIGRAAFRAGDRAGRAAEYQAKALNYALPPWCEGSSWRSTVPKTFQRPINCEEPQAPWRMSPARTACRLN